LTCLSVRTRSSVFDSFVYDMGSALAATESGRSLSLTTANHSTRLTVLSSRRFIRRCPIRTQAPMHNAYTFAPVRSQQLSPPQPHEHFHFWVVQDKLA